MRGDLMQLTPAQFEPLTLVLSHCSRERRTESEAPENSNRKLLAHFRRQADWPAGLRAYGTPECPSG